MAFILKVKIFQSSWAVTTMKMKTLHCFRASGTTHPETPM
jgi:hypothetical protein